MWKRRTSTIITLDMAMTVVMTIVTLTMIVTFGEERETEFHEVRYSVDASL
jgi:hypothetical protein